jgi:hypothetical protein
MTRGTTHPEQLLQTVPTEVDPGALGVGADGSSDRPSERLDVSPGPQQSCLPPAKGIVGGESQRGVVVGRGTVVRLFVDGFEAHGQGWCDVVAPTRCASWVGGRGCTGRAKASGQGREEA